MRRLSREKSPKCQIFADVPLRFTAHEVIDNDFDRQKMIRPMTSKDHGAGPRTSPAAKGGHWLSREISAGLLADKNAQVALVAKHFMPSNMDIQVAPARGPLMVTKQGLSVYTQTRFVVQYGSLETRDGYRVPYAKAKAVGTRGCVGECTRLWRPVFASGHEQSTGFWEVVTRADHTKQWAYKGSPLYTFAGDRQLGDVGGNDRYTPTFGDAEGRADLSISGGDDAYGEYRKGAALYWHLCSLGY